MDKKQPVDFGFSQVSAAEKTQRVRAVFESVATSYDLMNDFMSAGLHRLWKRKAVTLLNVRPGQRILDLAAGTGDLSSLIFNRTGGQAEIIMSDINAAMLGQGRDRLLNAGITGAVEYLQADAAQLPFATNSFDRICIGFGLRNVTDKPAALAAAFEALRYGGIYLVLEFSQLLLQSLQPLYDAYSFHALPWLGGKVADDVDSYRYLAESIRRHPDQATLTGMLQQAGFSRVECINLAGGIVAIHRAWKF